MSNVFNTRSPRYIKVASNPLSSVRLDLYIWTGLSSGRPASPNYSITKQELNNDNFVVFEVAELIRDFIYTEYYNEAVDCLWIQYSTTIDGSSPTFPAASLAIDGFGYFEEGMNPRNSTDPTQSSYTPQLLQDNEVMYFIKGQDLRIPIFAEPESIISFTIGGAAVYWNASEEYWETYDVSWALGITTITINDNGNSNQKIQYVNITDTENLSDGDVISIISQNGNAQSNNIVLKEICTPKYTPIRVIFYNKYGALQDVWFDKKSTQSLSTSSESYKANIIDYAAFSYNVNKHSVKRYNVEAKESITLNTGFIAEDLNEPIKQLLMSEQVWIDNGTNVFPMIIRSSSLQEKTSVNDKLIQYTLDFEYAFDKIQNIR